LTVSGLDSNASFNFSLASFNDFEAVGDRKTIEIRRKYSAAQPLFFK